MEEVEEDQVDKSAARSSGTTSISVWKPKWEVKASATDVKNLMGNIKFRPPMPDAYVPPPKPKMEIRRITRDGFIEVAFDQDMWVPKFRKPISNPTDSRILEQGLLLSEIDVTRDLVDIDFNLKSDI